MTTEAQRAHPWLQPLVGAWTYAADATREPGQPPATCQGSERVRSLGGRWILTEGPGQPPATGPRQRC